MHCLGTAPLLLLTLLLLCPLDPAAACRVLLLKVKSGQGVSPVNLLRNNSQFTVGGVEDMTGAWFKSPLLMAQDLRRLISRLELQMVRFDGSVGARLEFSVRSNDGALGDGRWFAKERLVGAWPWSLKKMKKAAYNVFQIEFIDSRVNRQLYVNTKHKGCPNDVGYMVSTWKTYCAWEKIDPVPRFLWTYEGDGPGKWTKCKHEAAELRLYGKLSC